MVGITPAARSLAYPAGAHARRFSDPKQRSERARGGERGADRHDESKSRYERFVNRATDQLLCSGIHIFRNSDGRKLGRLSSHGLRC